MVEAPPLAGQDLPHPRGHGAGHLRVLPRRRVADREVAPAAAAALLIERILKGGNSVRGEQPAPARAGS